MREAEPASETLCGFLNIDEGNVQNHASIEPSSHLNNTIL
jgi:hypothetical protein